MLALGGAATAHAPVLIAAWRPSWFSWRSKFVALAGSAALALVWALGPGFAAGPSGANFGLGAAVALAACGLLFARARRALRAVRAATRPWPRSSSSIGGPVAAVHLLPGRPRAGGCATRQRWRLCARPCIARLTASDIWGLGCFGGGTGCGVAVNSLMLATIVGFLSTGFALVLALAVQRGQQRGLGAVAKLMSVLPIVTPPFVIALALVVLFGRTGLVTTFLSNLRPAAHALDLWPAGRDDRPGAVVHADRLHDPVRRDRCDQPDARGSGTDAARLAGTGLPHRDLAAAAASAGQCLPARLRRKPGRLRQPDRAGRQFRGAVDQDLLRHRRRAARPGPRRVAGRRAVDLHADCVLAATALARPRELRQRRRQGRFGHRGGLARRPALGLHRHGRRVDRLHAGLLRRDRRRRLRQGHRPRRNELGADATSAPALASTGAPAGRASPVRPGTASLRRSKSPRSPRR